MLGYYRMFDGERYRISTGGLIWKEKGKIVRSPGHNHHDALEIKAYMKTQGFKVRLVKSIWGTLIYARAS